MFKVIPNPTFRSKVQITVPGGEKQPIDLEFKAMTRTELKAFFEQTPEDLDAMMAIVNAWYDVDAPFSKEAMERLLEGHHNAAREILSGYVEAVRGERLGN